MQRRFFDYFMISLKGLAMGAADAVPGVSGGTIAFISGIYEELITTIGSLKPSLLKTLFKDGFRAFWQASNGGFLLALLLGIGVSFVSFMHLAKYLLENYPVLIWAFFFGLILASIYFVGKTISQWRITNILALILGAISAFYLTRLPAINHDASLWFLGLAGAIAICAMILPGISGSFILIVLGAYKTLSQSIHDFDVKKIAVFGTGAIVGLLCFSRFLKWLFKHHHDVTLALLTGFIVGSLNKVWPWKKTISILNHTTGKIQEISSITDLGTLSLYQKQTGNFETYTTVVERSISPFEYHLINSPMGETQLALACGLMVLGFFTIFSLEKLGSKTQLNARH